MTVTIQVSAKTEEEAIASALEHAGVGRLETERKDIERDIWPRFVDDTYHTERDALLADFHAVGAGPFGHDLTDGRGQCRNTLHVIGNGFDALTCQLQAVVERIIGIHSVEIGTVGLQQRVDLRTYGLCRGSQNVVALLLGQSRQKF